MFFDYTCCVFFEFPGLFPLNSPYWPVSCLCVKFSLVGFTCGTLYFQSTAVSQEFCTDGIS